MQVHLYLLICVLRVSCVHRSEADRGYAPGYRDRFPFKRMGEDEYELPHTVNDDRCNGPTILREPEILLRNFGLIQGRAVSVCDWPGLPLRQRPGGSDSRNSYKTVDVFLGIPYAEPPTKRNDLQFKPPKDPRKWSKMSTVRYKPSCPQNARYLGLNRGVNNTDEDCLYLNIFVPSERTDGKKIPVMMYIHGGYFDRGSANLFPGHMLAVTQDVIVVTFNYRIGYLGFLSTADSASVGNYGMLDQQLALRWVYENIDSFGGDSESITLFGFDAGGVSASLLALSQSSKGMVKRVISHNGVPVADWAVKIDPLFMINTSQILGETLGCITEDSYRRVDCVGKRSNNEIKILELKPRKGWLPWGPVVDNFTAPGSKNFLQKSPTEMLEERNSLNFGFSYMAGVSRDEGSSILLNDQSFKLNYRFTEGVFKKKIAEFMRMYNYSVNANGIFSALSFMYSPSFDSRNESLLRQGYIDLLTDRYYKAPLYKMGKLLTKNRIPTYLYVTNYTLEGYLPDHSWQGVTSETDYLLLTGAPFMNAAYYPQNLNLRAARWTEADRNMSYFMLKAWANFAKEGNPTITSILNTILWKPATEENFLFLNINATNVSVEMIRDYREKESEFWNCYLPFLIDREPPTLAPTLEPGVEELRVVTGALYGSVAFAAIFMIVALVSCILYCRTKRKCRFREDLSSSQEIIVNPSVSHQDTSV